MMDGVASKVYDNPPHKYNIKFGIFMFITFNGAGVVTYYLIHTLFPLVLMLIAMTILLAVLVKKEYIDRPVKVEIGESIHLTKRNGEQQVIPFAEVEWVDVAKGDQTTLAGRINTGGYVKVVSQKYPIDLNYEIGTAIQHACNNKFGKYPPPRPLNWRANQSKR